MSKFLLWAFVAEDQVWDENVAISLIQSQAIWSPKSLIEKGGKEKPKETKKEILNKIQNKVKGMKFRRGTLEELKKKGK